MTIYLLPFTFPKAFVYFTFKKLSTSKLQTLTLTYGIGRFNLLLSSHSHLSLSTARLRTIHTSMLIRKVSLGLEIQLCLLISYVHTSSIHICHITHFHMVCHLIFQCLLLCYKIRPCDYYSPFATCLIKMTKKKVPQNNKFFFHFH